MRKRTYVLWKKILTWALALMLIGGAAYIYLKTGLFTIQSYEISGVPSDKVLQVTTNVRDIGTHPLYKIIPTNKIFTYQGQKIKAMIQTLLPDTESVSFTVVPLHTLKITIRSYSPLFQLDQTRSVTKEGYIFENSKEVSLPWLEIASSSIQSLNNDGIIEHKLAIRTSTSTEELMEEISGIIPKINAILFEVRNIRIDPYGDIMLSDASDKSSVKLTSSADMDKQWSNVVSAIDTEPLKTLLSTKKNSLEYLDVRFGNKVFYKFTKGDQTAIISDTHNATSSPQSTSR
jgi:hypothetical protein